jgi:aminoglycoside phosphotransferase (APT) family kinase protein
VTSEEAVPVDDSVIEGQPLGGSSAAADLIHEELVRRLVAEQFPEWAGLRVRAVEPGGVDHRTFRLGDKLSVRLPAGDWYALQVEKEQRWLPRLAPLLPLPIPTPVARGGPAMGYPYEWSVYRWISGEPANSASIRDLPRFASDLAAFLGALQDIDATGGPAPGPHNFFRGGPLSFYAEDAYAAVAQLGTEIASAGVTEVLDAALDTVWNGPPEWFHGDVSIGNLLLRDGRLAAVIDFGTSGVGDPACDTVIAWTLFDGLSRELFRAGLDLDPATWARGRGWALWKALITLASASDGGGEPAAAAQSYQVVNRVLADHAAAAR